MAGSSNIKSLVQGFAANIRQLKGREYKESQLRLHYLDPFWELLGWDVSNRQQLPPQDVEVVIEPSMDSVEDDGLRSREPDYLFRVSGFSRFIVEAKKPAVDLDTDRNAIFQAKRYAWHSAIPFAVLTDFEQFRLYDATLKPVLNDPTRGLVREFSLNFEQYPAQWEELVATFGREAVAGQSLERLRAKIKKATSRKRLRTVDGMLFELRGDEPVDRVFLDFLERHRQHLAQDIYRENKSEFPDADTPHGAARLTEAVQRLIDRLVFMRACEDRGVSQYGSLKGTLERISSEGGDLYRALCNEFRDLDVRYNGYLFKYHFSESLNVSGEVLSDLIRTLYPPDGPWDFAKFRDDILGIVYERFLGNIVTVKRGHATVEQKPEVRHAGGVYYTPGFVVNTIIRRVVGPQIAGKTPTELLDVKILDPACGSGSFLVAAMQYLIDHCVAAVSADPALASVPATRRARKKKKEIAFKDRLGQWNLAPDFKAALLTHCLHGVDIDQQAVEVTVMSLYLKMLEGTLPPNWQRDWLENELLPPLDNNILCGNSLIDEADFDRYTVENFGDLFPEDEDLRFRMNRFDWESRSRGFGRLLDSQAVEERGRAGFDCIIGNPPYIRVQELNKWAPDECEFYKWNYQSAARHNYDIYVVFVEKCLQLLAPDGLLGFIMPHKFWQAKYGEGLRKIIAEGRNLRSIVDFGHQQIFNGATTYTAIHVLSGRASTKPIDYAKFSELLDGKTQCEKLDKGQTVDGANRFRASRPNGPTPWGFFDASNSTFMNDVSSNATCELGEISARLYQGVRTSRNEVFILDIVDVERSEYFSVELGRTVRLDKALLKPFLSGDEMRRYYLAPPKSVAIFPYTTGEEGQVRLFDAAYMERTFAKSWKYFRECEEVLRKRENGAMDHDGWYGYGRTQNLDLFGSPRILVPDMMEYAAFALDESADAAFVSGYGIILAHKYQNQIAYINGLLNSSLLNRYLKNISTPLRGGWFRTFPQFLRKIPIKLPESTHEKKIALSIEKHVRDLMRANARMRRDSLSDRERKSLEGDVESLERRIDDAVLKLYGVAELPS